VMSTKLSGGYGSGSGTSFASPYVAGAKAIDLALNRAIALTGGNLDFNDASSIVATPSAPANETGSNVTIAASPANDNIVFATNITSLPLPYNPIIDTTGATTEAGDPTLATNACNSSVDTGHPAAPTKYSYSVWYTYTATATGRLHVNTRSSSYDTVVAIWKGTPGVSLFACNDNEPSQDPIHNPIIYSYLEKDVTVLDTYYIEVMSSGTAGGSLHLYFDYAPNPAPANDLFGGAMLLLPPLLLFIVTQTPRIHASQPDLRMIRIRVMRAEIHFKVVQAFGINTRLPLLEISR
jgi:hypothetical protein